MAQSDRGTITGTVSDPAKALVPNATILATNSETGAEYQTVTTDTGNYTLASVRAGTYRLAVTAAGFTRYIQEGIQVEVAQTDRIDVVLQIGSTAESVTVQADAPLLRTENAEESYNLNETTVNALPNFTTNLRDPFIFATTMPGVTGTKRIDGYRINGSPTDAYRALVDGQDITSTLYAGAPHHTLEQQPNVEALQEVTLEASNFAAEYGQVIGGLFNFTTKSGTNQIHGSAYTQLGNEFWGAGTSDTNNGHGGHVKSKSRLDIFGGSLGGPVIIPKLYNGRNKTFFFFSMEDYRINTGQNSYATVPTAKMRVGDFSEALTGRTVGTNPAGGSIMENMIFDPLTDQTVNGQVTRTPFPGNVIPQARLDPIALKIQAFLPSATQAGVVNNWHQMFSYPEHRQVPSIKIDHNVGAKSKFSFYLSRYLWKALASMDGLPTPITSTRDRWVHPYTTRLNYDYMASPTLLIHAGIGYVHHVHDDAYMSGTLNYDPVAGLGLVGDYTKGMPSFGGLSTSSGGGSPSFGMGNWSRMLNEKPTAVLSATLVRGNHSYKSGIQWRNDPWISKSMTGVASYSFNSAETALPYLQTTSVGGASIGLPYASFLLGRVDSATVPAMTQPEYRKNSWGIYVQDTWKITRKITLDYGLRWDYQQAPEEMNYRASMFGPTIPNPSAGGLLGGMVYEGYGPGRCNCRFTTVYPFAVGPRVGVAYQIFPKTVLRAAWGIVYGDTPNAGNGTGLGVGWNDQTWSSASFGSPAATLSQGLQYNPADFFTVTLNPGMRPSPGQINSPPIYMDRNAGRPPRLNQWNVTLQREITKDVSLQTAYVGNRGIWLQAPGLVDYNALTPQRIASFGLDVNSAADRSLLTSPLNSALAVSRGFNKPPYAGFPATLTVAQSLRPYPQFGTISDEWAPLGKTWYDALQIQATKRATHGIYVSEAFTWSKTMTMDAEGSAGGGVINNVFNRPNQKALSANDLRFVSVTTVTYRMPALGPNRYIRAVVGGWTASALLQYSSGVLIAVPSAQNNLSSLLFRGTLSNRVPGQPLFLVDPNSSIDPNKQFFLNPKAWSDPAAGQWGFSAPYYDDYRWRRTPWEQGDIGRLFPLRERMTLEFKLEFQNVFNRPLYSAPSASNALSTQVMNALGVPTSGFGYINVSSGTSGSRRGELVVRLQF